MKMAPVLAALLLSLLLVAPAPAAAGQPTPLFASNDPVRLVIQAPLSTLTRNREGHSEVTGSLTDPSGQALAISLRLRGITRRQSDICDFPPLRVQFLAPPPPGSLFAGQSKLKLVTHCRNDPSFQQYVLLEYAAYRMYNLLTEHSFRVRLATIDYRDASGRPIVSRVGYFLEDLSDVARRNDLQVSHAPARIPVSYLNPADAARYSLFQHMIANHDWSTVAGPEGSECCHNAELIGPLAPGATIVIPYDFDFSGLVGAPYATPPDVLAIRSVRQRYYRGSCVHNAAVLAAARELRDARPRLLAVLASVPGLDARSQSSASAFLEPFFADIASDSLVQSKILARCLGR